ncbi:MAG: Uma2 family endonuclease [Chitinophagales bacterium]
MKTLQKIPRKAVDVFKLLPEGTLCEVINNVIYRSPSPSSIHQRILKIIFRQIDQYVEDKELGEVFFSAIDVYFDDENVFQPDLIFISKENQGFLDPDGGFHGVPDFIVEILSPFNKSRDLTMKKSVYEKNGVREYWVIDPKTKEAIGYELREGNFQNLSKSKGKIKSMLFREAFNF